MIICLAFGLIACSKKDNDTEKAEATKEKRVQLKSGYDGVTEIMFPVPLGNKASNSDYDADNIKYRTNCPSSFMGIVGNNVDCKLYIGEDDIEDADSLTTDDIADIVNNMYMIEYKTDFKVLDQQNVELSGMGREAVQYTVFVKGGSKEFDHNLIGTYFMFNNKLYHAIIERYNSEFLEREISDYNELLQGIEEVNYKEEE